MNLWRQGPLNRNPYYRTAFRVARVPRETVRHRNLVEMIGRTKRLVNRAPQEHTIQGEPMTIAEVNAAEQILLDPERRIIHELLHHGTEHIPLEAVRSLAREIDRTLSTESPRPPEPANLTGLKLLAEQVVREFLSEQKTPLGACGALELELVPPFGPIQEDGDDLSLR